MTDRSARHEPRLHWWSLVGASIWLVFLAPAAQAGWAARDTVSGWVGLGALTAFGFGFVWSLVWAWPHGPAGTSWRAVEARPLAIVAALLLLGLVVVGTLRHDGLATAAYVAVAAVTLLPRYVSFPVAAALAVGGEVLARTLPGWAGSDGIGIAVLLAVVAVVGLWTSVRRSLDLAAAQEENALLLLDQERSRMARDLHDILGHSLTVVAVKAELADRLVDVAPDRAHAELQDIQRLSRDALADVRHTVHGARELSLPAELVRARTALAAAGIHADLPGSADEVPTALRALFAWTLREGVTNVVRHSGASCCTVTLDADRVSVADDGLGMRPGGSASPVSGHGLAGLRERAATVGAQLAVDRPVSGGFRLSVVVPSPAPPIATAAEPAGARG